MSVFPSGIAPALPEDGTAGSLAGRVWWPAANGPCVVAIRPEGVINICRAFPTMRDLCETPDPAVALRGATGDNLGPLDAILANTPADGRDRREPWLLTPIDLQAVKACGVTFPISMLERVIEERARGDLAAAAHLRTEVQRLIGDDLAKLKPGSPQAMALKDVLIKQNAWSQYLEVGIGPDAEIFTKAQPMSAVGCGAAIGLHPKSQWNNPEPEIVLACASSGRIVGAALGNDVNLRDFEGRSALLLTKAKDNNASCAVGPFIRLFDETFDLDDVRTAKVRLLVTGADGFQVEGENAMDRISRDPIDLAAATCGAEHQYPDGFLLFLGTMYVPTDDRRGRGAGFTHEEGDIVRISSAKLGALVNVVTTSDKAPPWTFGARALMRSLAKRGLI